MFVYIIQPIAHYEYCPSLYLFIYITIRYFENRKVSIKLDIEYSENLTMKKLRKRWKKRLINKITDQKTL